MAGTTLLQINQALLDAQGNFDAAAAQLGISVERLHDVVAADQALNLRWKAKPKAPPPHSILARPEDVAIAEAMEREEASIRNGASELKLSERARDLAVACQRFQKRNFSQIMHITGGGITMAFLEVLAEVETLNSKIADADNLPDEQRVALESIWREDRAKLLDFLYKAGCKVDQGILIQAKVAKLLGDGNKAGGTGPSKPGFSPMKRVHEQPAPTTDG